jgi:hypothetical protein
MGVPHAVKWMHARSNSLKDSVPRGQQTSIHHAKKVLTACHCPPHYPCVLSFHS